MKEEKTKRETDERRMLAGISKNLDPNSNLPLKSRKAYGRAIDELKEEDFSNPLCKKIFRELKNCEYIGEIPDLQKIVSKFPEDEKALVEEVLNTRGYPFDPGRIDILKERLKTV